MSPYKMISVFIPAFNEQATIIAAVEAAHKALYAHDHEVLVIDDSSRDDTPSICEDLSKKGDIRYVRYENGPTRRENLAASFSLAKGDIISYFDADMSAHPNNISSMIPHLKDADIIIASRLMSGSNTQRNGIRQTWSMISNALTRQYLGTAISDHQCGLKLFKREVILSLVDEMGYDRTGWRGFGWDSEMLVRATRRGFAIKEVPISWMDSKRTTTVNVFSDLWTIPYMAALKLRI